MNALYAGRNRRPSTMSDQFRDISRTNYVGKHRTYCNWCSEPVTNAVRDDTEASWLGAGAQTFCSRTCRDDYDNNQINAGTWLNYHGVKVTKAGYAVLYKAVDQDWHGTYGNTWTYSPGATVTADDYDPTPSCGGGLHLGVTPRHARAYHQDATRYVACKVKVAELIPLDDKCKVRSVQVLHEVTIDGDNVVTS